MESRKQRRASRNQKSMQRFTDWKVRQRGHALVLSVHRMTTGFPPKGTLRFDFASPSPPIGSDQLRRRVEASNQPGVHALPQPLHSTRKRISLTGQLRGHGLPSLHRDFRTIVHAPRSAKKGRSGRNAHRSKNSLMLLPPFLSPYPFSTVDGQPLRSHLFVWSEDQPNSRSLLASFPLSTVDGRPRSPSIGTPWNR